MVEPGVGNAAIGTQPTDTPVESSIGWVRAVVSALLVLAVGFVLLVWGPNYLVTHLSGLSRSGRVAVVTTEFFVVFVLFAWVLRRLQARRAI